MSNFIFDFFDMPDLTIVWLWCRLIAVMVKMEIKNMENVSGHLPWIKDAVIFACKHGSTAYGLNTELSDLDLKGVVLPPSNVLNNIFEEFNQVENHPYIHSLGEKYINPKNPKVESCVYSLKKFFILASNCNPNIIELLFISPEDIIVQNKTWDIVLENRELFLSSRARFTYAGYAIAQLKKIQRHRKWMLEGDLVKPTRQDFGLKESPDRHLGDINRHIQKKMQEWDLTKYNLDDIDRTNLKETLWEIIEEFSGKKISWDSWPDEYLQTIKNKLCNDSGISEEAAKLISAEYEYQSAIKKYNQWLHWKNDRNPERYNLEKRFGFDCKSASHLVRLFRTGMEILETGKLNVKRSDREEILAIKQGAWTYEQVLFYVEKMDDRLNEAYKNTKLPKKPNREKINLLYHNIIERVE
jgi:predicted nucleotidyltransferase